MHPIAVTQYVLLNTIEENIKAICKSICFNEMTFTSAVYQVKKFDVALKVPCLNDVAMILRYTISIQTTTNLFQSSR